MTWLALSAATAVITGAGSGIGRAITLELARHGARTVALDLDERAANRTAAEASALSGHQGIAACIDTGDRNSVRTVSDHILSEVGAVSVLVNNAGIARPAPVETIDEADWDRVLAVNLSGYLSCAQAFGAAMRVHGQGSIVHVASVCGTHPQAGAAAYGATKAGILSLSRSIAYEWGPDGVRSNCISPGMIRTPMTEAVYERPEVESSRSRVVPLRRVGTPQDVADVAAWLASDRSSYVTGQDILVDGGLARTVLAQVAQTTD